MRIRGESVPSNILLVSLNTRKVYLYYSKDYFNEIHKIYIGAASRNNKDFIAKPYIQEYDYTKTQDTISIQHILKQKEYLPIRIDEDSIVGWAERYYRENPKSSKGDFLGDDNGQVLGGIHALYGLCAGFLHQFLSALLLRESGES